MKSKKLNDCLNRFHVAMPKPRDQKKRSLVYLKLFWKLTKQAEATSEKQKRKLEKDLEEETGGAGVYSASLRKHYVLADDEWKEDIMPEILDGHNVYDFIDPDILIRVEELDQEEGVQQGLEADDDFEMDGAKLTPEEQLALAEIRKKKRWHIQQHRIKKSTAESRPAVPRKFDKDKQFSAERMGRQLSSLGLDPTMAVNCAWSKSRGRKRERSLDRDDNDRAISMDVDGDQPNKKMPLSRSLSRSGQIHDHQVKLCLENFKDTAQKQKAIKMVTVCQRRGTRMLVKERRIESFLHSSRNTCSLASFPLGKQTDVGD